MSERAVKHVRENESNLKQEFFDLIRIRSISTDDAYKQEVMKAADWLVARMKKIGLSNVGAIETGGQPMVCAEWLDAGPEKPTVLLYAHYDIQPVDPVDLWDSDPYEPTVKDGKIVARGIVDDKIGIFACLSAVESLLEAEAELPVNIKFLFEGEEETGSPSVEKFAAEYPSRVDCDTVVICDGSGPVDAPRIVLSCRGLVSAEVSVTGPPQDMHSGLVGGVVENPIHVAARIAGSFHDTDGRIAIPDFYDGIAGLSEEEKVRYAEIQSQYIKSTQSVTGAFSVWGDPDISALERITMRPTCDVNGIYGGYQGEGMKTIIPSKADMKVTMRIAPGQNPDDIAGAFKKHVMQFNSDTTRIEVKIPKLAWPSTSDAGSAAIDALSDALRLGWGKEPIRLRTGGTVPIAGILQRVTGNPPVFFSPGVGGLVHSPNEFMYENFFITPIEVLIHFLWKMGLA